MSKLRHYGSALQEVAGNGLLHRRALLRRGIKVAGALGAGAAGALNAAAAAGSLTFSAADESFL